VANVLWMGFPQNHQLVSLTIVHSSLSGALKTLQTICYQQNLAEFSYCSSDTTYCTFQLMAIWMESCRCQPTMHKCKQWHGTLS